MSNRNESFKRELTRVNSRLDSLEKKPQFLTESPGSFLGKNWWLKNGVVFGTLFISLIGGLPGGCAIWQSFSKKPKFDFKPSQYFFSHLSSIDSVHHSEYDLATTFILMGTISNKGEMPLLINYFKCNLVNGEGEEMILMPHLFRSQIQDALAKQFPDVPEAKSDLFITKRVDGQNVATGTFLFILRSAQSSQSEVEKFEKSTLRLTCVDQNDKEYTCSIKLNLTHRTLLQPFPILPLDIK